MSIHFSTKDFLTDDEGARTFFVSAMFVISFVELFVCFACGKIMIFIDF